nr:hypothetical protein [Thalassolituus oleivorans]
MQIETLRDVLLWTKEFHQHLSQCLSHCVDKNTDERARMILAYLSDHEESLTKVVNGFETTGNEHALNTWCYEYVNKQPVVQHAHCDAPFSELDSEQIIEIIVNRKRSNNPTYQLNNRQLYIFRQQFFNIFHRFTVRQSRQYRT